MGSKNQTTKSVCLNHNNELDKKILKHVSRRNFSGYVKKLILAEINKSLEKKQTARQPKQELQESKEDTKLAEDVQTKNEKVARSSSVQGRNRGSVASSSPLIKISKPNQ